MSHQFRFVAPLVCLLSIAGCSGGGSAAKYIPESGKARQSLETALNAWKSGEPLKTIKSADYAIDTFDARWRAGEKLESFEIVSEEPASPEPTFNVQMRVNGKDVKSQYHVLGIDPILVFRAEDYTKATGM